MVDINLLIPAVLPGNKHDISLTIELIPLCMAMYWIVLKSTLRSCNTHDELHSWLSGIDSVWSEQINNLKKRYFQ